MELLFTMPTSKPPLSYDDCFVPQNCYCNSNVVLEVKSDKTTCLFDSLDLGRMTVAVRLVYLEFGGFGVE
jgi:hypothetical protein